MQIAWGAHTDAGRRPRNEDHHLAYGPAGLFAVADGMGGHAGGDVASRIAVESLRAYFAGRGRPPRGAEPEAVVGGAIAAANSAVHRSRRGQLCGMGSTVAALWLRRGCAIVGHLGDSRVYRLRGGSLERLTRDHSLAELFRERGADEAAARRVSHLLTRSLGQSPEALRPELRTEAVEVGDVYLLCSDGLSDVLGDDEVAEVLGRSPPRVAAVELVDAALAAGSSDNVTALVVALR